MTTRRAHPLVVAIDRSLHASMAEVRYALRTLLHTAGFGVRFLWHEEEVQADVYYGPRTDVAARVTIPAVGWGFDSAPLRHPGDTFAWMDAPYLVFPGADRGHGARTETTLTFPTDIVFSAYWLLTGAVEPTYPRSRFDDLDLDDSILVRHALLARPMVSLWAARIREALDAAGLEALPWAWESGGARCAFAFTHDVDYPEIIRPIEVLRVLRTRGLAGVGLARRVASGESHFWHFTEWVELARRHGTRPCFYFMARRGSLLQYALGTPDDFYDVSTPRFQRLFAELRDAGCEVGLHASYHAHRSADTLRQEAARIAEAAGVACEGNRHHYWHLDPDDPNETLRRHGEAGLLYDSSLGLEYYPGFRRGVCHPFRVFHPGLRRELPTVQLPPAWMDDHFDRRLPRNRVADPDAMAAALLDAARATRGIITVDYHNRGMNADFYPRYGPWLARFLERHVDGSVRGMTPGDVMRAFVARESMLAAASRDETAPSRPISVGGPVSVAT